MPEPDIAIASRADGKAIDGADLHLAIEISDSTLTEDLGTKLRLYAGAGLPEYWVVDVERRVIHQLWSPLGDAYAGRREHAFGARVEAVTLAGVAVETSGLN